MFRYAEVSDYTLINDVSEFLDGEFQDPTNLTVRSGFGEVDGNSSDLNLSSASWDTDDSTDPPTYGVLTSLTAGDLDPGYWMMYVEVAGELYEVGVIEIY